MTTKVLIANAIESNGDVILNGWNTCEGHRLKDITLAPGSFREVWITDYSMMTITEDWPTAVKVRVDNPGKSDGEIADACGDRGDLWAAEFHKRFPHVDEGVVIAWFANAIEAACAKRIASRPLVSFVDIRGAVSRAWCADPNRSKEMDGDLAEAASQEVAKLFGVDPSTE